jgi:glycosyltransferase involved in cell wall biosynthesis
MKAPPRISVIVPCYNAADYVAQALASVVTQQSPPGEIIVVDDGSTDASITIVEQFGRGVRCVRQDHQGAAAARNRGVAESTGDILAFLDADDVWPTDSLAVRSAVLEAQADVDTVSGKTRQFISPELPDEVQRTLVCPPDDSAARVVGALLVRRAVFDRVGGFDSSFRIGETLDWIARADLAGVRHVTIDAVVLRRRIHATNTTTRLKNEKADYLRMLKASLDRRRAAATGAPKPDA